MTQITTLSQIIPSNKPLLAIIHLDIRIMVPILGKEKETKALYITQEGTCIAANPFNKNRTVEIKATESLITEIYTKLTQYNEKIEKLKKRNRVSF